MSEVKRYKAYTLHDMKGGWMKSAYPWTVVHCSDYDAAQSELAALREELATMTADRDQLKGIASAYIASDGAKDLRIAAVEQRNSVLEKMITEAHAWVDQHNFGGCDAYDLRDRLAAALKPAESGASE